MIKVKYEVVRRTSGKFVRGGYDLHTLRDAYEVIDNIGDIISIYVDGTRMGAEEFRLMCVLR